MVRILLETKDGEWIEFKNDLESIIRLVWTMDYHTHLHICNRFCIPISDHVHCRWENPILVVKNDESIKVNCKGFQNVGKIGLVGQEMHNLYQVLCKACGDEGVLDHRIVEFYHNIKDQSAFKDLCDKLSD